MYTTYLLILSQLSSSTRAQAALDDHVLYIEKAPNQDWVLSTKICDEEDLDRCSEVQEIIRLQSTYRWQSGGAFLKRDASGLFLICHMKQRTPSYKAFKSHVEDFIKQAHQWKEIVHSVSRKRSLIFA